MHKYKDQSELIHHALLYLSAFKTINMLIAFLNGETCLHESDIGRYLSLFNIAFETIYRTILASIICFLSQGTSILHFEWPEALFAAKVIGCSYLVHSLYFVTVDYNQVHGVVRYILLTFYSSILWIIIKGYYKSLMTLRESMLYVREDPVLEANFKRAHKLKHSMLIYTMVISIFYSCAVLAFLCW